MADAATAVAELADEIFTRIDAASEWANEIRQLARSLRDEVAGVRSSLGPMSHDLDALRAAFAATTDQLELLRDAVAPELAGVRAEARALRAEVSAQREAIDAMNYRVEAMGERLAGQLEALNGTVRPLVRDAEEMREVVEPLQSATERLGRFAERLPGPGRKHLKGSDTSEPPAQQ